MAILGVFGKLCFSPFLVTKTQMCLTGSITSENKGGGSDPLRKKSIVNPLFFCDGFPYRIIFWPVAIGMTVKFALANDFHSTNVEF